MGPCGWWVVGGWVKKGILKGKGAQKGPRVGHCIIQIRRGGGGQSPEKRSKKGLKGLGRRIVSFRLVQARPLRAASAEKVGIFSS